MKNKEAENFQYFLESMDKLYDSVTSIMDIPMEKYSTEDWAKIGRRINKLADELNLIFEKNGFDLEEA